MGSTIRVLTKGQAFLQANCLASDAVGDGVYITGPKVGALYQVAKVDVTDGSKMPARGIIVTKQTSTRCTVQTSGVTKKGIITGLTPNETYVLGGSSTLVDTPPVPGIGASVYIQHMGQAISSDEFDIELDTLVVKRNG